MMTEQRKKTIRHQYGVGGIFHHKYHDGKTKYLILRYDYSSGCDRWEAPAYHDIPQRFIRRMCENRRRAKQRGR